MEWLLVLVAGGGAVWGGRYWRARRIDRQIAREDLESVRSLAEEDVTLLGEELSRLGAEVSGMSEEARGDYQKALDSYESARLVVPELRSAEEISKITDTLSQGRYALSCVRARVAGQPVPEWRTPCFFNPQHGPSVRDVWFVLAGHGTRQVPACAQDAARVDVGERPEVRKVKVGSRTVPYWRAGSVYLPYSQGYFVGSALVATGVFGASSGSVGSGGFNPDYGGAGDFGGGGIGGGGFDGGGGLDGGGFEGGFM